MKQREYVYLPGGDPYGAFSEAAKVIVRRALPYIGKYNVLFNPETQPYKTVARGLSQDLGIPVEPHNLFFGHGVKESMLFSARLIDWLCRNLQELISRQGYEPPKFKFLIRTPSYKHVVSQFQGYESFECKFVSSYDGFDIGEHGLLNHANLMDGIKYTYGNYFEKPFEYTIGYLDINPCNPTGHVRGMAETVDTANILERVRAANDRCLMKVFGTNPFNREPFILVEDHIYRGLEFGDQKTVSFCQLGKKWQDVTQTVFGVAKYGLVGMRGSVTVAPRSDVRFMHDQFKEQNSDISPFSVLSCAYMFGDNKADITTREKFLNEKTQEYERNVLIATAIIDGKARDFLSAPEYETAATWLVKYGKLAECDAHKLLEEGINGIKAVGMPRAGFFLMLNYDDLIRFSAEDTKIDVGGVVDFIRKMSGRRLSMYVGDSEHMGLSDEHDAVARFTVAIPPKNLISRLLRLRELSEFMKQLGPMNSDKIPPPEGPYTVNASATPQDLSCNKQSRRKRRGIEPRG